MTIYRILQILLLLTIFSMPALATAETSVGTTKRSASAAEETAYSFDTRGRRKPSRSPTSLEEKTKRLDAIDDPWLSFLSETSTNALVTQIKENPKLGEQLRQRLSDLKEEPGSEDKIKFIENLLQKAAKKTETDNLSELTPLPLEEAFSPEPPKISH